MKNHLACNGKIDSKRNQNMNYKVLRRLHHAFYRFFEGHFKMKFLKEMCMTSLEIGDNILVKWNAYSLVSLFDTDIFNFVR